MLRLDKATLREYAVQASCDPRTLEKILGGLPVRGMAGHRARAVLKAAGVRFPEPEPAVDEARGRP
jgi:hypothetical protein